MEKTIFTRDEIRDFFAKLSREIQGESLLLPSMKTLLDPEILEPILTNQSSYTDFVSDLSKKQGVIEGKIELMLRLMDFFNLKISD